jgi:outer membrane protein assembly factor BamB
MLDGLLELHCIRRLILMIPRHIRLSIQTLLYAAILLLGDRTVGASDEAHDWPQFLGPADGAIDHPAPLPADWRSSVRWRTPLPGPGGSSPIVVGHRIFLTCYSGYGVDPASPGQRGDLVRHLLCFNRADGKLAWQRDVPADDPVGNYVDFMRQHGYATSTPVCDGERVYASLENSGIHAFDLEGQPLWHAAVGRHIHNWGSAASLAVDDRYVYVNAAVESDSLVALDRLTGREAWRFKRVIGSWSTPCLIELPGGGRELVLNVKQRLLGIDRVTGAQVWSYRTDQSVAASTPVVRDGQIYISGGNPKFVACLKPGGGGELDTANVVWRNDGIGSNLVSPLIYRGRVYILDRGVAACLDAASGKVLAKTRLTPTDATFYASPVVADKKVFAVSRESGIFVLATEPAFEQLANNHLDDSVCNATPAVHAGELLLRSNRFLYCIGAGTN